MIKEYANYFPPYWQESAIRYIVMDMVMKKSLSLILTFLLTAILQGDPGMYGDTETFRTNNPDGNITTTIVLKEDYQALLHAFEDTMVLKNGEDTFLHIFRDKRHFFVVNRPDEGLFFTFSLEKADKSVIQSVILPYMNDPETQKEMYTRYKDNYIIRIHSAENIHDPENKDITDDEIRLMASLAADIITQLLKAL